MTESLRPIYNNAPWTESVEFLDVNGDPEPITGRLFVAVKHTASVSVAELSVAQNEFTITGNTAEWTVPSSRIASLIPGMYLVEIGVGVTTLAEVLTQVPVRVIDGINP